MNKSVYRAYCVYPFTCEFNAFRRCHSYQEQI